MNSSVPLLTRWAAVACMAMTVAACGGGDATTAPAPAPAPVAGSQTGVLTDSPIAGVAYTTSSGVSGVTDANGNYDYNPGDTVEFKLGGLSLGTVSATGVVSPIQLAKDDGTKLQNLLVLLQSLDSDGDPSNGISIPTAAANALTNSVDLTASTTTFASGSNTALVTARSAGGITGSIRTPQQAREHFISEGMKILAGNIWVLESEDSLAMIRMASNGRYVMGTSEEDDFCGAFGECGDTPISTAGVEVGTMTIVDFDSKGYKSTVTTSVDTNLQGGFSHPLDCDRITAVGEALLFNGTCPDSEEGRVGKAPNASDSIVGVWALGSTTTFQVVHMVFLANGKWLLVDPIGDEDMNCKQIPGIESGTYTWANGKLKVTIARDTNDCAGLSQSDAVGDIGMGFVLSSDGKTITLTTSDDPEPATLYRVSK